MRRLPIPLTDFVRSAVRPSMTALVGAVTVCAGVYGFLAVHVTSEWAQRNPGSLAISASDEYPFVQSRAGRLRRDLIAEGSKSAAATTGSVQREPPPIQRVIIVGDSGLREAIVSKEGLQHEIEHHAGRKVEVTLLVAGGLTGLDATELLGLLGPHVPALIVVQVSPYDLAQDQTLATYEAAISRVGLNTTDLADEFAAAHFPRPWMPGNYFLRNYRFLLDRFSTTLWRRQQISEPSLHLISRAKRFSIANITARAEHIFSWTSQIVANSPGNVSVYARLVGRMESRGATVALVESVQNPSLPALMASRGMRPAAAHRHYRDALDSLVDQTHVPIWNLEWRAKLTTSDFADYVHICTDQGRQRYTEALALHIARQLNGEVAAPDPRMDEERSGATTQPALKQRSVEPEPGNDDAPTDVPNDADNQ